MNRSPSRRTFAALAVAALAGCVSLPGDDSANDESTLREHVQLNCVESIESPDPYPDVQVEYNDVPDDADVSMCVQPVEPFNDDSPAKIAVELTNVSDDEVAYTFDVSPPYDGVSADQEQGDGGLILIADFHERMSTTGGIVPSEPTDGCWRALHEFSAGDYDVTESIVPAETVREEYTLLADPESECLALGTYRSEEEAYDPVGGQWGFQITLSE